MKLVVQEFLTLDGVSPRVRVPGRGHQRRVRARGWFVPHLDEEFDRWSASGSARRTRSCSAAVPTRTSRGLAEDERPSFAGIMNGLLKYVASHSLTKAEWNPTTILSGDTCPGRRTEAAARPGTADPRQRPAGPVPTGRRADRLVAARDRPGGGGSGPTPVPGRRRTGRPAARQPSDDTRRPVGTSSKRRAFRSSGPTGPTRRHPASAGAVHYNRRASRVPPRRWLSPTAIAPPQLAGTMRSPTDGHRHERGITWKTTRPG